MSDGLTAGSEVALPSVLPFEPTDSSLDPLLGSSAALSKLFKLPLNVLEGHLGELVLQIPWSNLKNQPVKVVIQDVFLLAEPRLDEDYDPEEESRREQELKKERLERLELLEKSTPSQGYSQQDVQKNQSFTESLINKTIENLQITIRNIHIRYEDQTSVPGHPFSLGFTLEELSALSTDDEWNPKFIQSITHVTRKLAKLNSLAIYWNTDSDSIRRTSDDESGEKMLDNFRTMIISKEKAERNQYILKPVSGIGRITLNKFPSDSQPKSKVQLIFDELGFVFDSDQYRDALWTADLFRLYMNSKEFKRFRPTVSVKEDPKAWFKYAAEAVRSHIHEKNKPWNWDYLTMRLQIRRRYIDLYKLRTKSSPPGTLSNPDEQAEFKQLEFDLSFEDIKFYRSLAKAELRKEQAKVKEEKKRTILGGTSQSDSGSAAPAASWTSWIWGGGAKNANQASNGDDEVTMTEEQRKELYDVIEWDEKAAVEKSVTVPQNQITLEVETALESGSFTIRNDPHGASHDVAAVYFNGFKAQFLQRPTSFLTSISLQEFRVDDKSEGTLFKQIVTVKPLSHEDDHTHHNVDSHDSTPSTESESAVTSGNSGESSEDAFFWLSFEKNPLDESADSSLHVKTKSITIFYNAHFLERVARFFKPPKTHLETIGAIINAAGATVEGIRNQTRIGLEYALQEHKTANVKLDLQAPLIVIPLDVTSWKSPCVIIDAGHISLLSELAPSELLDEIKKKKSHQYKERDWERLESLMYDKFKLQFHDTQILLGNNVRDTMKQLHQENSENPAHVIDRINMDFLVEISILPEAYSLTKFKVTGHLPLFSASMSDAKYKLMMQIIDKSIPNFNFDDDEDIEDLSDPDPALPPSEIFSRPAAVEHDYGFDSDEDKEPDGETSDAQSVTSTSTADIGSSTVASSIQANATSESQNIFVFVFKIDKVELSLHRCIDDSTLEQSPLVDMVMEQFELEYCFRSLEMTADVTLGSLRIEDYIDTKCPSELRQIVSSSNSGDSTSDLFKVKYRRIKLPIIKKTGEEPSDQIVEVSMSTIRFVVEPKTFLTLLDFIITTFTNPEEAEASDSPRIEDVEPAAGQDSPQESVAPAGQGSIDVRVDLRSIILILNDEGLQLGTLKLDSALVSVRLFGETMNIHSRIGGFSLQDDTGETQIPSDSNLNQLISIEGDELADFRYETFDRSRKDLSYNSSIYFRLGSLRVNVIEKPLSRIIGFASRLLQMKGLYDRARQLAMNQANQIESPDKIRFDVIIKTPIFFFPTISADSGDKYDSVTANLGEIYLQNKFESVDGVEDVAINNVSAGVRDMKLTSRFYFEESWSQNLEIIDKIDILFDISKAD
ncbi:membrane morphogenesis protein VPS13 [Sugiyamaella lignohabitans]|uniref:Membrane morphogenesis protein VPS13 n=1 Tax=Sugiyamaella lignohabitans TaxID=796027 RepID=A0A167EV22_9ASCO|nr:membrane morphogenesis protein VPS13 [Sugiyamaella lignohabitans]ANB14494.1 membrane morphogenesis protein VPS13 [Sugiyamaella lignohabitans]